MECTYKNRGKRIRNYIDNLMSEDEKIEFEKHLFECDKCFNETRIVTESIGLIREEGNELFAEYLSVRNNKKLQVEKSPAISWYLSNRWIAIPVAALLVFVAGLLYVHFLYSPQKGNVIVENTLNKSPKNQEFKNNPKIDKNNNLPDKKDQNIAIVKKQTKKGDNKMIAEDFRESPNFENLLSQEIRSGFSLKVISPLLSSEMKGKEIVFAWKTNLTENIFIEIYNNKEKHIFSSGTKNNQISIENKLKPGLYYWKLESEENLLYVGKFLVN